MCKFPTEALLSQIVAILTDSGLEDVWDSYQGSLGKEKLYQNICRKKHRLLVLPPVYFGESIGDLE